ncbi:hypothetical protein ACOME3_002650 [Neoechinorhynchus agilis]
MLIQCKPEILKGHKKAPRSLTNEQVRPYLYSCSADGILLIHNVETTEIVHRMMFDSQLTSLSLNSTYKLFATSTMDGVIRIFNIDNFMLDSEIYSDNCEILCVRIKDGLVYYGTSRGDVRAVNFLSRNIVCKFAPCKCKFVSANNLEHHLTHVHFPSTRQVVRCLWENCLQWIKAKDFNDHVHHHANE